MFVVKNSPRHSDLTLAEHARRFDYFGALTFSAGLVLILIAMVQGVVADPVLSQPRAIVGLKEKRCLLHPFLYRRLCRGVLR